MHHWSRVLMAHLLNLEYRILYRSSGSQPYTTFDYAWIPKPKAKRKMLLLGWAPVFGGLISLSLYLVFYSLSFSKLITYFSTIPPLFFSLFNLWVFWNILFHMFPTRQDITALFEVYRAYDPWKIPLMIVGGPILAVTSGYYLLNFFTLPIAVLLSILCYIVVVYVGSSILPKGGRNKIKSRGEFDPIAALDDSLDDDWFDSSDMLNTLLMFRRKIGDQADYSWLMDMVENKENPWSTILLILTVFSILALLFFII